MSDKESMKGKIIITFFSAISLTGCSCSINSKSNSHTHIFNTTWHYDAQGHYHECISSECNGKSTIIPHSFNELNICEVCGYAPCVHDWSAWEVIEDPTCIEQGVRERYCLKCALFHRESIPTDTIYGHRFISDTGYYPATCTTDGHTNEEFCTLCGKKIESEIIKALGHNYEITSIDGTCDEPSTIYKECSRCHDTITEEVDFLKHTFVSNSKQDTIDGYTTLDDTYCERCHRHIIQWKANDVSDDCKNKRRLIGIGDPENGIEPTYEPNYIENDDGGIAFYGRPIHNALDITSQWANPSASLKIYDSSIAGSFFEYKFSLDSNVSNAELVADIDVAEYSPNLFAAGEVSWTPGLIDEEGNVYDTRYVVSMDGNVLEQDLTRDIKFDSQPTSSHSIRKWFTFPLKDRLNLAVGEHTLRISMADGYRSTFYNFGLELHS